MNARPMKSVVLTTAVALVLTACGDDDVSPTTAATAAPTTAAAQTTAAPTSTTQATEPERALRVAFITDGTAASGGWYGAMDDGRLYFEEEVPTAEVVSIESVTQGQMVQRTLEDLADDGYDLIIATSNFDPDVALIAPQYPNTVFLQSCDATILENMAQYCVAGEQGRYVDGQLAASLSESGKIGYVIGFPIPSTLKFMNAFVIGAQTINPDVEVVVITTNSWFDPTIERQAAESLVNAGADVLTYDLSSSAVPEVAAQNGLPFVGLGYDDAATQAPDAWVGGSLYNWGPSWVATAEQIMAGTWATTYSYGGYPEGAMAYSPLANAVPADVAALVASTLAELTAGNLHVFAGPIVDGDGNVIVPEGEIYDSDLTAVCCDWIAQGISGDV